MTEKKIQFISAEDTMDLRSRILRPGQPLEACRYAEDNLPSTFHIGVLLGEKLVSNGTFMQQQHPELQPSKLAYRLRGMATDPEVRNQGLGRMILEAAEAELRRRQCDLLWFNARVSAEGFYRRLGYDVIENIFDIACIGPHKVMYRWL
jgi:GNAT superfamily N-acetyltransferase